MARARSAALTPKKAPKGTSRQAKHLPTATLGKRRDNPSNGVFSLYFDDLAEKSTARIYNSVHEMVFAAPVTSQKMDIDLSSNVPGFYYYVIASDTQIIGQGKLIVD